MRSLILILFAATVLAGCHGRVEAGAAAGPAAASAVPLGNPPGEPQTIAQTIANPVEGDAAAIADGKALFSAMNCVYCHGANASGLIGPPLNTQGWRYGGSPIEIYNSIHDGRPQGMPAWGERLPPEEIWKLVAYVETLGGAQPPAPAGSAGDNPSTTGDQVSGQDPTDSAHAALIVSNARRGQ